VVVGCKEAVFNIVFGCCRELVLGLFLAEKLFYGFFGVGGLSDGVWSGLMYRRKGSAG